MTFIHRSSETWILLQSWLQADLRCSFKCDKTEIQDSRGHVNALSDCAELPSID